LLFPYHPQALGLPWLRSGDPGFRKRFNPKPNPSCGRIFGFYFSLTILKPWDCRRCAPAIQVLGGDSIQSQILPAVGFSAFAFPLPSSSLGGLGLPSLRSGDPGFGRRFNPKPNPSCGRIFGFCFSLTILKPWGLGMDGKSKSHFA
jgi:hypothetical protein